VVTRIIASAIVVGVAVLAAVGATAVVGRRHRDDAFARHHFRRLARYATVVAGGIALLVVWREELGRLGLVVGLAAAGVAFAMQEVIGAAAGWFNILSGRIYRVGDRVQLGGVRGDVIDITPLRTKILEIGAEGDPTTWVQGRQHTGRVVAVSNKATFTEPVFNYSAGFDYIWEEIAFGVPYRADWETAERIVLEEIEAIVDAPGARQALAAMARHYPVPRTETEPRVFVRAAESWMELAARFIVPVRTARTVKDEVTRRVRRRFDDAGIEMAFVAYDVTVRRAD